jgi:uncharacterized protein (TIRG00374 family)
LQTEPDLKLSQTARRVLRAALAIGILVWLARSVGIELIMDELAHVELPLLIAATLLLALDGVAKARNWQQLLIATLGGQSIALARVLKWHFAGGFLGAIVPSSAGTDACRVWMGMRGLGGHGAPCAASILTVNGLGWFTGSILGLIGLIVLALEQALPRLLRLAALVFVGTLLVLPLAYGLLASRRRWVESVIERAGRRSSTVRNGLTRFLDAVLVFEQAHVRFPIFLLVSAAGLLAQTGMFALTAQAVGIDLPFAVWLVLVPLTRLVALVPVSIADFGLIQAAHVSVLTLFGVPPSESFALSALFAVEGLLIHCTLGSSAFLFGGRGEGPQGEAARQGTFSLDGPKSVR